MHNKLALKKCLSNDQSLFWPYNILCPLVEEWHAQTVHMYLSMKTSICPEPLEVLNIHPKTHNYCFKIKAERKLSSLKLRDVSRAKLSCFVFSF